MDPILVEQELKVEAYGFVEDLVNSDESAFELLEEDELVLPPVFDDDDIFAGDLDVENIIDDLLDADLEDFDFAEFL